jgi:hypothetical protein
MQESNFTATKSCKTYPYAKLASERLTILNKGMANLKTNKEKKRYFKIVEII